MITNKENLVNQIKIVGTLLADEENVETKMMIESLFCLNQMINIELSNRLCVKNVFEALTK